MDCAATLAGTDPRRSLPVPTGDSRKADAMAHLSYPSATEVQLRLGAQEDAILRVVRHWGWWTYADVEGRLPGDPQVAAVILTAHRGADRTIREIMRRSFQIVFPPEGGAGEHKNPGAKPLPHDAPRHVAPPRNPGTIR